MTTAELNHPADAKPENKPEKSRAVDLKLEVIVIPVSDVDRAKAFYASLGWRLDADFASGDGWRVIQFTPPGSACSVIFGKNVTAAAPGSAQGLYLIVSDLDAARQDLLARGVKISEPFHGGGDVHAGADDPYLFGSVRAQRRGSKTRQLQLIRLLQGSRRQRLVFPGSHNTAARPDRGDRHQFHLVERTCTRVAPRGGGAWRAREAHRHSRRELAGLVRRLHRA